jgi:hypothetical protein
MRPTAEWLASTRHVRVRAGALRKRTLIATLKTRLCRSWRRRRWRLGVRHSQHAGTRTGSRRSLERSGIPQMHKPGVVCGPRASRTSLHSLGDHELADSGATSLPPPAGHPHPTAALHSGDERLPPPARCAGEARYERHTFTTHFAGLFFAATPLRKNPASTTRR